MKYKKNNNQLYKTNIILEKSITKEEILLKEIHHRIKNNLQIVMSLLDIQNKNVTKKKLLTFIENSRSRIGAMALIHQNLYLSNCCSYISVQEYLEELTQSIKNCFGKKYIPIKIQAEGIRLDLNVAIPIGLIINELVCNTLKHGFLNEDKNKIIITVEEPLENHYILTVSDNGIGMNLGHHGKSKSIGLELVNLLVLQLRGTIIISHRLKKGTQYQINFHA